MNERTDPLDEIETGFWELQAQSYRYFSEEGETLKTFEQSENPSEEAGFEAWSARDQYFVETQRERFKAIIARVMDSYREQMLKTSSN